MFNLVKDDFDDNMEDIIVTPDKFFRILGIPTGLLRNHLI